MPLLLQQLSLSLLWLLQQLQQFSSYGCWLAAAIPESLLFSQSHVPEFDCIALVPEFVNGALKLVRVYRRVHCS